MMNTVCITLSPILVALELAATVYILQALNQQPTPTTMSSEPGMSKIDYNVMRALNQKPAPTITTALMPSNSGISRIDSIVGKDFNYYHFRMHTFT